MSAESSPTGQSGAGTERDFALRDDMGLDKGWRFTERPGLTPFGQSGAHPEWTPSIGKPFGTRCWLDECGDPWLAHDCSEGREAHRLGSRWQAIDGGKVAPSYSCDSCGLHYFAVIDCSIREEIGRD